MTSSEHSSITAGGRAGGSASLATRRTPRRGRGWVVRRALVAADVVGLVLALLVTEATIGSAGAPDAVPLAAEFALLVVCLPMWIVAAKLWGLYDRDEERTDHSTVDDVVALFHLITVGVWLLALAASAAGAIAPDLTKLAVFWAAAVVAVSGARATARAVVRRSPAYVQRTIVLGADAEGQRVARKCLRHPEYGLDVIGFVGSEPEEYASASGDVPLLGDTHRLAELVSLFGVERVIVAFPDVSTDELVALVRVLQELNLQVDVVPRLARLLGPGVDFHTIEGLALVGLTPSRLPRSSRLLKRAFDVVGSIAGLAVTAPLFVVLALGVKLSSPGPVLFRQTRIGLDQREFTMLKFRTMRCHADDGVHREYIRNSMDPRTATLDNGLFKLERGDVITAFGRWLRRTSLDELPQLLNVLRGEMSLVGPRPCLAYEVEHFAPEHFERFRVPPGVTGLWQVTARSRATFGEALDLDVAYVRNWSLGLDLWLLCRTPAKLFGRWSA